MRILYIITQGDAGGAQRYVLDLAKAFGGQIATGTESDRLAAMAEDAGISVHRLFHLKRSISPLDDMLAIWDIVQLIKKTSPDIIHLNSSKAGFIGSMVKLFSDVKIVYTAHGFVFNEPGRGFYATLERFASRFRDYIIAVSEADLKSALSRNIIAPSKISVVNNGIGEIQFLNKVSARQYLGIPLDKVVIGTIANFYTTKGIDVLIRAAVLIPREHRQHLFFAVMGDGEKRQEYEKLIEQLRLQDCFKLTGSRELASHYLRAFDIFTLPSRKEGFPYALLEALQAGLPIVATNVGGNSEALQDAGVLVPSENPPVLSETLVNLIFGKGPEGGIEKLTELSGKAITRSQDLTLQTMIQKTQKVYNMVLSRPN